MVAKGCPESCRYATSVGSVLTDSRDVALVADKRGDGLTRGTCVSNAWIASRLTPSIDFAIFHAEPGAGPPTPISPPSGPMYWLFQGLPQKANRRLEWVAAFWPVA
jgi:hypothetical protein